MIDQVALLMLSYGLVAEIHRQIINTPAGHPAQQIYHHGTRLASTDTSTEKQIIKSVIPADQLLMPNYLHGTVLKNLDRIIKLAKSTDNAETETERETAGSMQNFLLQIADALKERVEDALKQIQIKSKKIVFELLAPAGAADSARQLMALAGNKPLRTCTVNLDDSNQVQSIRLDDLLNACTKSLHATTIDAEYKNGLASRVTAQTAVPKSSDQIILSLFEAATADKESLLMTSIRTGSQFASAHTSHLSKSNLLQ